MSNLLQIADNSKCNFDAKQFAELRSLAGVPIKNLQLDSNSNLLVFPQNLSDCPDNIQDSTIFTIEGDKIISTGNIMGFVGYKNMRLRIHSRFAKEEEQDFFLHYMLQRVFAINLFDLKYTSNQTSVFDFLIYLFPAFLKRAFRQGLYKEYQTLHYNNSHVRGKIDIAQHIRKNIPFTGNISYKTREYAYDNSVTQLVRHTIEYIRLHPYAKSILQNDADTKEAVKAIEEATISYNRHDRVRIISMNLRPILHPYYCEYRYLQQLCLQILRHEELKYGTTDNEIYGILFDGAWLWEEYLATILTDYIHPRNKERRGVKYLFENKRGPRYPDFYNESMVLDAKYKSNNNKKHVAEIDRDDIHQIVSYMWMDKLEEGGFISPTEEPQNVLSATLKGHQGKVKLYQLHIPTAPNWTAFVRQMRENERTLLNQIS